MIYKVTVKNKCVSVNILQTGRQTDRRTDKGMEMSRRSAIGDVQNVFGGNKKCCSVVSQEGTCFAACVGPLEYSSGQAKAIVRADQKIISFL